MSGYDLNVIVYVSDAPVPGWYEGYGETHDLCSACCGEESRGEYLSYCGSQPVAALQLSSLCDYAAPDHLLEQGGEQV